MRQFIELLLETIDFRAVEAGRPVLATVAAAAAMAKACRRYDRADVAAHEELIIGSWRPLVFANPDLAAGQVDKAAFTLCAVMHLHAALRAAGKHGGGAHDRRRWIGRQKCLVGATFRFQRRAGSFGREIATPGAERSRRSIGGRLVGEDRDTGGESGRTDHFNVSCPP